VEGHVFTYKDTIIKATVSIGFAVAEHGIGADYDQMKHIAAGALAEAKFTGRNRCILRLMPPRPFEQAG